LVYVIGNSCPLRNIIFFFQAAKHFAKSEQVFLDFVDLSFSQIQSDCPKNCLMKVQVSRAQVNYLKSFEI
jgi:hypothetical protein